MSARALGRVHLGGYFRLPRSRALEFPLLASGLERCLGAPGGPACVAARPTFCAARLLTPLPGTAKKKLPSHLKFLIDFHWA